MNQHASREHVPTGLPAGSRLRALHELPPLAQNAQRLVDVLADDNVQLEALARAIEHAPTVAARVLGLAGSAYFGSGKPVTSVREAVIRVLGLRLVRSVTLGIVMSGAFDASRCPEFNTERYWAGSLLTAWLCRTLGALIPPERGVDVEAAYLCGLLHNLGLLALVNTLPREMSALLREAAVNPARPLRELERELLGTDHGESGAWLCERWHLPPQVPVCAAHYHALDYDGAHWQLVRLVGVSARCARHRLAGVAEPLVRESLLRPLGLSAAGVLDSLERCEALLGEIDEMARLLARPA